MTVRLSSKPIEVGGAVLIWGAVTPEGREAVMRQYAITDVLSVEAMLEDLRIWAPETWTERMARYRGWTDDLFDFVLNSQVS